MYMLMSRSGLSASRNSSWAMMMLATSSLIGVPRKMMRSMRSREKMSYVRSPRLDRSMTYGRIDGHSAFLVLREIGERPEQPALRVLYQVLLAQPGEHLVLGDAPLELLESPSLLQRRVHLSRLRAALLRHVRHPLIDVGFGSRESFALRRSSRSRDRDAPAARPWVETRCANFSARSRESDRPRRTPARADSPSSAARRTDSRASSSSISFWRTSESASCSACFGEILAHGGVQRVE